MTKTPRLNVAPVSTRAKDMAALEKQVAELREDRDLAQSTGDFLARRLEEAQKEQKERDERLAELQATIDRLAAQRDQAVRNEQAARKAEAETRDQFAELKERLHQAELTNARLQGYLDRVSEDDAAREEPRVINELRTVPRRPLHGGVSYDGGARCEVSAMNACSDRPRKHWTGF